MVGDMTGHRRCAVAVLVSARSASQGTRIATGCKAVLLPICIRCCTMNASGAIPKHHHPAPVMNRITRTTLHVARADWAPHIEAAVRAMATAAAIVYTCGNVSGRCLHNLNDRQSACWSANQPRPPLRSSFSVRPPSPTAPPSPLPAFTLPSPLQPPVSRSGPLLPSWAAPATRSARP